MDKAAFCTAVLEGKLLNDAKGTEKMIVDRFRDAHKKAVKLEAEGRELTARLRVIREGLTSSGQQGAVCLDLLWDMYSKDLAKQAAQDLAAATASATVPKS